MADRRKYRERVIQAPEGPGESESVIIEWSIQHRFPGGEWATGWVGDRHTPQGAEHHEILAHQALDRGWGATRMETRLIRQVATHRIEAKVVPAMWEDDEEFCSKCRAGTESDEHRQKCGAPA